jgi:Uncharacterized conserved protein
VTNDLSAEEVRALLKLEPHATCGFVRVTFISNQRIAPGGLPAPFLDGRPAGSALYFMVTPEAPVRVHRIRNDQLYHRYLGDPIEILMLHENGTSERVVVGPDLRAWPMRAAAIRSTLHASSDNGAGSSVRAQNVPA